MIAVAAFVLGVLVGIVFVIGVLSWGARQPAVDVIDGRAVTVPRPRRESLSERHDRLDAEAREATS